MTRWVEDIDESHPNALSEADLRDGVGQRREQIREQVRLNHSPRALRDEADLALARVSQVLDEVREIRESSGSLRGHVGRLNTETGFDHLDSSIDEQDGVEQGAEYRLTLRDLLSDGHVSVRVRGCDVELSFEPLAEPHVSPSSSVVGRGTPAVLELIVRASSRVGTLPTSNPFSGERVVSALEVFRFEGREVRTVLVDGEPWFAAVDVARILGLGNVHSSLALLDADEQGIHSVETPGGPQLLATVSESGLYSLVIRSRKPEARVFKRWLTREVIPAIRRTGAYVAPESREQLLARAVLEATAAIAEKDERIAVLTPRAEAWDELADAGTDYAVGDAAKILQRAGVDTGPQRLFEQLREFRWIFRGGDRRWRAYSTAVHDGYLAERAQPPRRDPDTGELVPVAPQVRVTARGLERLRVRLGALALT